MKILILDSNQRCALAITRSLARSDHLVYNADTTLETLSSRSKYSKSSSIYSSPSSSPERFIGDILSITKKYKIALILPLTDETNYHIIKHRNVFGDLISTCPSLDQYEALTNKCSLFRIAEKLGIPYPATQFIQNAEKEPNTINSFPIVIKPCMSYTKTDAGYEQTTVTIANNEKELKRNLHNNANYLGKGYMLQDFIPGSGAAVFCLYKHGKLIEAFCHKRLREKPPEGGVSVLAKSTPLDQTQLHYATQLLDHVNWHGIAMVEFRIGEDHIPYLMEVNTRFWGSTQLAISSGVNFPVTLLQPGAETTSKLPKPYKTGIKLRWLLGDLDRTYIIIKKNRYSLWQKTKAIVSFLTGPYFRTNYDTLDLADLGPFLFELKNYFKHRS